MMAASADGAVVPEPLAELFSDFVQPAPAATIMSASATIFDAFDCMAILLARRSRVSA
jgi:hypothetical protein